MYRVYIGEVTEVKQVYYNIKLNIGLYVIDVIKIQRSFSYQINNNSQIKSNQIFYFLDSKTKY